MEISPINRDVIYRTRSAGSNISQYIWSTRETWILIILLHSVAACNLQHFTVHCNSSHSREVKKWNLHMNHYHPFLLHYVELKFLCSALPINISVFVIIICGPLWLTFLLHQLLTFWNITAIYQDWLYIYLCEIYRQYIGTGCTRSALARQMKF